MKTPRKLPLSELPSLHGKRTSLRWMTEDDLEDIFAIWGDPKVMRYMSRMPLVDMEETRDFLESIRTGLADGTLYQWGITKQGEDRVIGTCTLVGIDHQNRRAEIGFALHRDFWRQGFMSEAANLALGYAFHELDLNRIDAEADPRNPGSLRLLESLGFQREGYQRECLILWDEVQDAVMLGLLRREWVGLAN